MIRSFKCRDTQALYDGKRIWRFANIDIVATRKLQLLDDAAELWDLSAPSANRLEAIKGNRKGQHSIRINDQWRICFCWGRNGPEDVEIVDYH